MVLRYYVSRIAYDSTSRIEIAYSNLIPLKAIDSINMSEATSLSFYIASYVACSIIDIASVLFLLLYPIK